MPFNVSNIAKETSAMGTPKDRFEVIPSKSMVLGMVEQSVGVYQMPSMRKKVETYYNDPLLQEGVVDFADQVLSTGVFYSANPEYTKKVAGKTALQVIQRWADDNNIDLKLQEICTELKAFGNSYWMINKLGFIKIPIEAVWHAVRADDSIALQNKYNLELDPVYQMTSSGKFLNWGEFIHFRVNITGYHAPFGIGMMDGMLARPVDRYGHEAPSIYDIRLSMRGSLDEGFRKFSFGNVWIGVPDLSNEDFDNSGLTDKVANMKSTGNRVVTNSDVKVALEVPQRTQSYDEFIKQMRNEFFMAVGDPQLKMGLEEGFTKATAESTLEMYRPRVAKMRLAIKQQFEDLFKEILEKLGFDGAEAAVKMNFGPQDTPVYEIKDLFMAIDKKVAMPNEVRKILVEYHKWNLVGNVEDQPEYKEMMKREQEQMQLQAKTAKFPQSSKVGKEYTEQDIKDIFNKPIAKESEVDSKELEMGIKSELEHTSDREVAKRIALAHLLEDSKYYSKLLEMERK